MLTLFVSHSSKTKDANSILDRVTDALVKAKVEVWSDRCCIQQGQQWRNEIFWGIWKSHGAVLLLSKEALEDSTFVTAELVVLMWRHRIGQRMGTPFPVYPILIGDVAPSDLKSKNAVVAHLQIDETQALRSADDALIATLLARIDANFLGKTVRDGLGVLTDSFVSELRRVGVSDADIQDVRAQIKRWPERTPCQDPLVEFAQEILRADLGTACDGIARLSLLKGKVGDQTQVKRLADALLGLVHMVIPFWVDEAFSLRVPLVALGPESERIIGIIVPTEEETESEFLIKSLLARACTTAYGNKFPPFVYDCAPPAGEDGETWIVQKFVDEVVPPKGRHAKWTFEQRKDLAKERIAKVQEFGQPCFLLGCEDWVNEPALKALREEFNELTPALIIPGTEARLMGLGAIPPSIMVDRERAKEAEQAFDVATGLIEK